MPSDSPYSVADHWNEPWEPLKFKSWALKLRRRLLTREIHLGLIFLDERCSDYAEEIVDILRSSIGVPVLTGALSGGVIVNEREHEGYGGVSLALYSLPGSRLRDYAFSAAMAKDAASRENEGFWRRRFEPEDEGISSWLIFCDPLTVPVEKWLDSWERDFPGKPIYGGLSHVNAQDRASLLIWNDSVVEEGGVAIGFAGGVTLDGIIAQGCCPVGDSWTITRARGNALERIGNRPAFKILDDTFRSMTEEQRSRCRGNLFVGLAVDEYVEEYQAGDFLVRNIMAADPKSGSLAVGAFPRVGQTLQFQMRDALAASQELKCLAGEKATSLEGRQIYGACLSNCLGRGHRLFGAPHHDASAVYPLINGQAMAGFFGNGEFGPIGSRNFVHGYTCSLAMFVES